MLYVRERIANAGWLDAASAFGDANASETTTRPDRAINIADVAASAGMRGMSVAQLVERTGALYHVGSIARLYAGSYFCSQYFLGQLCGSWHQAFSYCRRERIPATLVVPAFSSRELDVGKRMLDVIISDYGDVIDEITVNDTRMLGWCAYRYGRRLNAGRMLSKDPSTPRYPAACTCVHEARIPAVVRKACLEGTVHGFEIDPAYEEIDITGLASALPSCTISVHGPYCHLATSTVCKLAGQRPGSACRCSGGTSCSLECLSHFSKGRLADGTSMLSWGRSLLFKNGNCHVEGGGAAVRSVITPFDAVILKSDGAVEKSAPLPAA